MMKRFGQMFAVMLCLLLCLTACNSVAGRYDLVTIVTAEETIQVSDMKDAPQMYLVLNGDGTGIMQIGDDAARMYWEDGFIWAAGEENNKVRFTVEGKTLIMEQADQKMIFTKSK